MSSQVLAKIGYVGRMVAYPVSAATDPAHRSNLVWDFREMPIHNGRTIPGGAKLETHGFEIVRHKSSIEDFDEAGGWRTQYAREIEDFLRQMTGAREVIIPSIWVKDGDTEVEHPGVRLGSSRLKDAMGTVDFCHNDFTSASVGRHVAALDPDKVEERLSKPFNIYNTWRLVSPPPQSKPLAVCDPTTITIADLVPGQTYYFDEIYHQNALLRYNPAHRWYYYPDLEIDELLIWLGYSSDPGMPSIVPHGAFENPECTDPGACRVSVDCRGFAFFDD